jgi:hypothetical protein
MMSLKLYKNSHLLPERGGFLCYRWIDPFCGKGCLALGLLVAVWPEHFGILCSSFMTRTPHRRQENHMSKKYHLILRIVVASGIFLLYYSGKFQGEAAFGLIAIIVSSVFGKARK